MDDRLCGVESMLAAMTATVSQVSETLAKVQSTIGEQGPSPVRLSSAEWPALSARPAISETNNTLGFSNGISTSVSTSTLVSNSSHSQCSQQPGQSVNHRPTQTSRSTDDWSAAMSTPQTLAVARNSCGYDLDLNQRTEEFKTVRYKRRRRVHSSAEAAGDVSNEAVVEISLFFDIQDGRRPPSWIFKNA